ncbi:hypothetical protein [Microbacterium sp. NPDC057944]|uniref:hypothetical protein n=1 Tax=Microbacterium sp. NPDC057944 TaxID=3346286 RepID=UPI0036DD175A
MPAYADRRSPPLRLLRASLPQPSHQHRGRFLPRPRTSTIGSAGRRSPDARIQLGRRRVAIHRSFVAAPTQVDAVQAARPSIPRELDRATLADLSDKLGVFTLTDPERYALRD